MKIVSFCKTVPTSESLQMACQHGWLDANWELVLRNPQDIEVFREGSLGVDPRKIQKLFDLQDNLFVLTEEFLVPDRKEVMVHDHLCVFSTRSINQSELLLSFIALYADIWNFLKDVTCEINDTKIEDQFKTIFSLPSVHEKALCDKNFFKRAVRFKIILLIINRSLYELGKFDEINIKDALQKIKPSFSNPLLKLTAIEMIIDDSLRKGSDKRTWLINTARKIEQAKETIKNSYLSYRDKLPNVPLIIPARRWNSWTPNLPRTKEGLEISEVSYHKGGGGYFIWDGRSSLVIDPGYGFLDILHRYHKISVMDIDAVVISHDHPDHTSDLQNILDLRYVYREQCKPLKVFLNPSSFYIYERMFRYYTKIIDGGRPYILKAGGLPVKFNDMELSSFGMFHDEIYSYIDSAVRDEVIGLIGYDSKPLGLRIMTRTSSGDSVVISIPGDTSFPKDPGDIEALIKFFNGSDIVCFHLGSIEEGWMEEAIVEASSVEYKQRGHLGFNGVVKFINLLQPKVAVITEFGEELDEGDNRLVIIELIKEMMVDKTTVVVPSDVQLFLALNDNKIYFKCKCGRYVLIEKLSYPKSKNGILNYAFEVGCESDFDHVDFHFSK